MKSVVTLLSVALVAASTASSGAQTTSPRAAPARATVVFTNQLPGTYELRRVRFWVDGVLRQEGARPFEVATGSGDHVVSVEADYRLHDPVLPYVDGYELRIHSAARLPSRGAVVVARAVEAGGVTAPLARRAEIVWR